MNALLRKEMRLSALLLTYPFVGFGVMALLPVGKRDVVKGKYQFVMLIELCGFALMAALGHKGGTPGPKDESRGAFFPSTPGATMRS